MHLEAGGNSIGFFMDSELEAELAGEALFVCARACANEPLNDVVCEPERLRGYASTPLLNRAGPENLVRFLLPTGHSSWVLRSLASGARFRLYWDVCDRFVTLVGKEGSDLEFCEVAIRAMNAWRVDHPEVTANWD